MACLYELGRKDEANEIAERLQNPDSMVSAYMSASRWGYYGVDEQTDPSNALDRLRESKHESGLIDPHGLYEASLLFELENYEEAWMLYNRAIETGHLPYSSSAVLYRAGLSKWEAEGETDSRLLNLALWYDPESKLSERAQEALQ